MYKLRLKATPFCLCAPHRCLSLNPLSPLGIVLKMKNLRSRGRMIRLRTAESKPSESKSPICCENFSITESKRRKILSKLNGRSSPTELLFIYMGLRAADKKPDDRPQTIYFNSFKSTRVRKRRYSSVMHSK